MDAWLLTLINIGIGWGLGLLAPAIGERIKRDYRLKDLKVALNNELHELQYIMALSAYKLSEHSGEITDEFLMWFENIVLNYNGDEPNESFRKLISHLKTVAESDRFTLSYPNGNEAIGITLII